MFIEVFEFGGTKSFLDAGFWGLAVVLFETAKEVELLFSPV